MDNILKQKIIDDGQIFYKQMMRQQRNNYLKETDKFLLNDYPATPEQLTSIKEYRQLLRDFTNNNYVLPEKPDFITL